MNIEPNIPTRGVRLAAPLTRTLRIAIEHVGKGHYRSTDITMGSPTCDRVLVEHAREPFFDSARVLIARGHDPEAILEMSRKATPEKVDMRGRLGTLAKLTVHEPSNGSPRTVQ